MKELLLEACYNTILGIGTVFVMLIIMSLLIYCFRIIPTLQEKFSKKDTAAAPAPKKVAAPAPVRENLVDDLELVAVIAAAIAASEQVPVDSFQVRTIKRRR